MKKIAKITEKIVHNKYYPCVSLPFVSQGEESRGYQELVEAAKRVSSVPVAVCTVKEVWADYNLSSDTITLFRKVLCTSTVAPFCQHETHFRQ